MFDTNPNDEYSNLQSTPRQKLPLGLSGHDDDDDDCSQDSPTEASEILEDVEDLLIL
jgi:hypothetical protein